MSYALIQEIEMTKMGKIQAIILSSVGMVRVVGAVQAKNQRRPKGASIANTTPWTLSSLIRTWLSMVFL